MKSLLQKFLHNLYSINWRWCLLHFIFVFLNSRGRYMACISGVTYKHFCMHHACISGVKKGAMHIICHYDIFWETFVEKNGYLNSSWEKIQFQKQNRLKRSPETEVMIISKSTKFQRFFRKWLYCFQNFIQNLFGYYSLQEDKVDTCGNINDAYTSSDLCRQLDLQQNLQRAQICTVARSS